MYGHAYVYAYGQTAVSDIPKSRMAAEVLYFFVLLTSGNITRASASHLDTNHNYYHGVHHDMI
jgi:hypothetical protein